MPALDAISVQRPPPGFAASLRRSSRAFAAFIRDPAGTLIELLDHAALVKMNMVEHEFMTEHQAMTESRPPLPPFTHDSAVQKVRAAENGWNTCDPAKVALAYTEDSCWRNRAEFIEGRPAIIAFLGRKWRRELDYRLIKELWCFGENRIAVRFAYEWHDDSSNWFRSYGNENWEFSAEGLMRRRFASINDVPIQDAERKFRWDRRGPRPAEHPGLSQLDL